METLFCDIARVVVKSAAFTSLLFLYVQIVQLRVVVPLLSAVKDYIDKVVVLHIYVCSRVVVGKNESLTMSLQELILFCPTADIISPHCGVEKGGLLRRACNCQTNAELNDELTTAMQQKSGACSCKEPVDFNLKLIHTLFSSEIVKAK